MRFYLIFFAVLTSFFSCTEEQSFEGKKSRISYQNCDFSHVQTGDIVLKRGFGKVSRMITQGFNEKVPISHCGIIVCTKDSNFIVHSVSSGLSKIDGVQTILFKNFLDDCQSNYFYVVRKKINKNQLQAFANKALEFSQKQIPFDHEADNDLKNKMSCTELIYWCQKETFGYSDINTKSIAGKEIFVFNGLLDTSKYKIIYHY